MLRGVIRIRSFEKVRLLLSGADRQVQKLNIVIQRCHVGPGVRPEGLGTDQERSKRGKAEKNRRKGLVPNNQHHSGVMRLVTIVTPTVNCSKLAPSEEQS